MNLPSPPESSHGGQVVVHGPFLVRINIETDPLHDPSATPAARINTQWGMLVMRHQDGDYSHFRQVHLSLRLVPEKDQHPAYAGNVQVATDVELIGQSGKTPEELDCMAAWAAVNILLGSIRAYVQMVTGLSAFSSLFVSPVDPRRVVRSAQKLLPGQDKKDYLYPELMASEDQSEPDGASAKASAKKTARKTSTRKASKKR